MVERWSGTFINLFSCIPVGCTIILGVTIVVPVCMIVFGMLYMYDCPQGEYIPVYLLVGGECYIVLLSQIGAGCDL